MQADFVPDADAFSQLLDDKPLDVVCLADAPWNYTLWTNRQYAVSTLAQIYPKARILYLEPASFFCRVGYPARDVWPSGAPVIHDASGPNLFCSQVQERVWAIHPPLPVPARLLRKNRAVFPMIQQEIVWLARRAMQTLDFRNPVLWVYTPYGGWHLGRFDEVFRIYESVDDHALSSFYAWDRERLLHFENKLTEQSNVAFSTSKKLLQARKAYNPNSYLVTNPVNYNLFAQAQAPTSPRPHEFQGIEGPLLGFYGILADYRVDSALLQGLAETYSDYNLILVSNIADKKFEALKNYNNVIIIPSVVQTELIKYVSHFDVLLMPYQVNEYISFSRPLKMLEYFSTGKPIVSSFVPEEEEFRPLMYLGTTHQTFLEQIPIALADRDRSNQLKRIAIARQYTWEHKVYCMLDKMVQHGLLEKLDS